MLSRIHYRSAVYIACLMAAVCSCNMYSQSTKQIEANIDLMRTAQEKVTKNPSDKGSLAVILKLTRDGDGINRANAAAILGELGVDVGEQIKGEAVPALVRLLDKGDGFDKQAAACALRSFGKHGAAAARELREHLIPSDNGTARCAAEALGSMRELAKDSVLNLMQAIKANVDSCDGYFSNFCKSFIPAVGKIGPAAGSAIPDLEVLLNHKDAYVRMRLSIALIRIDPTNKPGLRELEGLLQNHDVEVRKATIGDLKEIGAEATPAREFVRSAVRDPEPYVSESASELLHMIENPQLYK